MDSNFDEHLARSAKTVDEAQQAIIEFLREGQNAQSQHNVVDKSHGFDLYLPWMMEVIEYVKPAPGDEEPLRVPELHRLYMDAAWGLVIKGLLRPGPKALTGGSESGAYGRAYSLIGGVEL